MKNLQVIIADEPTSALDEKCQKQQWLSCKKRTVIILTHNTKRIERKSNILDLNEGAVVVAPQEVVSDQEDLTYNESHRLSIKNTFAITKSNVKSKVERFLVARLSQMSAGTFLLTTVSGPLEDSSHGELDELIETYGEGLTDISVIGSFMSASGNEEEKPNTNVAQELS